MNVSGFMISLTLATANRGPLLLRSNPNMRPLPETMFMAMTVGSIDVL